MDARHNHPRIGRIVMCRGRDAADVAISTAFGLAKLVRFDVVTQEQVPAWLIARWARWRTRTAPTRPARPYSFARLVTTRPGYCSKWSAAMKRVMICSSAAKVSRGSI